MKYFLFLDESGDHGLTKPNPDFPVFLLCGVLVTSEVYEFIRQEINKLKESIWGDKKVIFHQEDRQLDDHFQRLCARGTNNLKADELHSVSPTFTFRNKRENINGLQLADLVAYPIARYVIEPDRANPAFEILKPRIYKTDKGLEGLKIYP